jgi:hypothetical protein
MRPIVTRKLLKTELSKKSSQSSHQSPPSHPNLQFLTDGFSEFVSGIGRPNLPRVAGRGSLEALKAQRDRLYQEARENPGSEASQILQTLSPRRHDGPRSTKAWRPASAQSGGASGRVRTAPQRAQPRPSPLTWNPHGAIYRSPKWKRRCEKSRKRNMTGGADKMTTP